MTTQPSSSPLPKVAILMATYNGEKYLAAQLDSLAAQTHTNWCLFVSDDGSIDGTKAILQSYQQKWGTDRIQIRTGPMHGVAQNFLTMAIDPSIQADYYAFCDQDDVWLSSKLTAALDYLGGCSTLEKPYLYCSRTVYVTDDLEIFGHSPAFVYPPAFRNALVQNIASGNTIVFNRNAKLLLEKVGVVDVVLHDWWVYQLITGVDGVVFFDKEAHILYRQHAGAVVGGVGGWLDAIKRIFGVIKGDFKKYTDANIAALNLARVYLTDSSINKLEMLICMRQTKNAWKRFRILEVCGLYRQTWQGTVTLHMAAFFRKI